MKKEESLIEVKENKFKKFLDSVKSFFGNLFKKNNNIPIEEIKKEETENITKTDSNQTMQDMEILGKVVKGEIKSSSLEPEVQERLIQLCRKRNNCH